MAHYFRSTGANWGTVGDWSSTASPTYTAVAAVPTATDDVIFEAASANCIVNTTNRVCKTINFTTYINTITMTFGISVSGDITLGALMNVTGTGFLAFNNVSATYTSNGYEWPNEFRFITVTTSKTYTIASDCSFGGVVTNTGSVGAALANIFAGGRTITCKAGINLTVSQVFQGVVSNTTFIIAGGTLNGSFTQFLNVTLNSASTITWNAVAFYSAAALGVNAGTFTYTAGTISGTRTLSLGAGTVNLGTNVRLTAVSIGGGGLQGTLDLSGDLYCEGTLTLATFTINTSNSSVIYTWSYAGSSNNNDAQGTGTKPKLVFNGTGIISFVGTNGWLIEINTTGTVTITSAIFTLGSVTVAGGFNWISGEVIAGPILSILRGTTFNFSNINWRAVVFSNTSNTVTLSSDLYVSGDLTIAATGVTIAGPYSVYAYSNFAVTSTTSPATSGGAKIVLAGTGTFSQTSTINIGVQVEINTPGKITISGTIYKNGNFTYVKGTIDARRATLIVLASSTGWINMHRVPFKTVTITGGTTQTMNEFFGGKPGEYCTVSSTTTTNVTITFTDTFEKFARWVTLSGMTLSQRGQVKLLSSRGSRSNTNLGFISYDGSPYGIAKNNPITYQGSPCYGIGNNPSDPSFF